MRDAVAGHDLPLASLGISGAVAVALAGCGRVGEALSVARQVAASADELDVALVTVQAREVLGVALIAAGGRAEAREGLLHLHDRVAAPDKPGDVERGRGLVASVGAGPRVGPAPRADGGGGR